MTDISREAVAAAKIWLSRMNDCVLSRCGDCDGSERGISGLLDALLDRNEKLEADSNIYKAALVTVEEYFKHDWGSGSIDHRADITHQLRKRILNNFQALKALEEVQDDRY